MAKGPLDWTFQMSLYIMGEVYFAAIDWMKFLEVIVKVFAQ